MSFIGAPNPNASSGYKSAPGYRTYQTMPQEGMDAYKQMAANIGPNSYLSRLAGGDQSMFEQMEAPAMRQFQQLQGQNASRFSGMGMGARHGSGFQNYQNQATSDFSQDLASKRMGLQRQALMDLSELSNMLMGHQPYSMMKKREKQGTPWGRLTGMGVGAIGGSFMGNPALGAQIGGEIGGAFDSGGGGNMNMQGSGGFGGFSNPFSGGGSSQRTGDIDYALRSGQMSYI